MRENGARAEASPPHGRSRVLATLLHWLPAIVISDTFLLLSAWTWGRCADPQIDFGREVYVAWRLSEGDVLYRDVHSIFGPLSPYWNAAGLAILGTSIRSLTLLNLGTIAVIVALMWALLRRFSSRLAGTTGIVVFLCAFAFAHTVRPGSFNFVAPYRHELVHAAVLSLGALLLASMYLESLRTSLLITCGMALGALALTKVEPFAATCAGVAAILVAGEPRLRPCSRRLIVVAGSAALVFATAVLALALRLPLRDALRGAGATFITLMSPAFNSSPFVRLAMGVAELGTNLRALWWWCLVYGVWGMAGTLAAIRLRRWSSPWAGAIAAGMVGGALWPLWRTIAWSDAARPLPLVALVIAAGSAVALRRSEGGQRIRHATILGFAVYAVVLIAKIGLTARTYHYGFALAPPALLLLVAFALDWWPSALERRGYNGWVFRGIALALLALAVHAHLRATSFQLSRKRYALGEGADRIYGDEKAEILARAAAVLSASAAPPDTLAVFPEALLLNYVLRMRNPSPYAYYMPSEVQHYGERTLLDALSRSPPEWIAFVDTETSDFGVRYFGQDYGVAIFRWTLEHYEPISLVGPRPFSGNGFGVAILRRRGGVRPSTAHVSNPPRDGRRKAERSVVSY